MATIPELLDGHVTLEVECLDRLYLNGYIGKLATGPGLFFFMQDQLGKPIPSPVVLGQISERFREAVKALAEQEGVPVYQFRHKERKDDIANSFRRRRNVRDAIVFIGVAQEKAQAFNGKKVNGRFQFDRDKTVYVNHYYFYIDDEEFGPLFLKICSYAPRSWDCNENSGVSRSSPADSRARQERIPTALQRPRWHGVGNGWPGQCTALNRSSPRDRTRQSAL
jgi:hypothetical protein